MSYKKFYIQKLQRGSTPEPLMETSSSWDMWCSDAPFPAGGVSKDLPQNDWGDEDGIEEYYPEGGMPLKSYDIELTFYTKGSGETIRAHIDAMLDYLTGRDGRGCEFSVWDEYTQNGAGRCRFVKMSDTPEYTVSPEEIVATVKVTLRVTDPRVKWKPSVGS